MDTFDVIKSRRSIHSFKDKKIPDEILYAILDAGHCAPAAGHITNWRFLIVESEESKKAIAKAALGQYWMIQAPIIVIVCSESSSRLQEFGGRGEKLYSVQNVAAAIENILLAAHNFGVSSCWVGAFTEPNLRKEFRIPDYVEIHAIVPLGYSNDKPRAPSRPAFTDVLHFGAYGESERHFPSLRSHATSAREKLTAKAKRVLKSASEKVKKKIKRKK